MTCHQAYLEVYSSRILKIACHLPVLVDSLDLLNSVVLACLRNFIFLDIRAIPTEGDLDHAERNISDFAYFFDCFADNVDTINVDPSDCSVEFVSADASTADGRATDTSFATFEHSCSIANVTSESGSFA